MIRLIGLDYFCMKGDGITRSFCQGAAASREELAQGRRRVVREQIGSIIVIVHHAVFRTFYVIEFAFFYCPDKDQPGGKPQEEGEDDEDNG